MRRRLWRPPSAAISASSEASLPLIEQDAHVDLVPELAVAEDCLAGPTLNHEAALFIGADRASVEFKGGQSNSVQGQAREGMGHHEFCGFGAVALAPRVVLADGDVEESRPVVAVELAEGARADQLVRVAYVDRHRQEVRTHDPRVEEALDFVVR